MDETSDSKDKKNDKQPAKEEETGTPPVTTHRRLESAPGAVVSTSAPTTPAGGTPAGGTPNGGTPTVGSPLQSTTPNTSALPSTPNTSVLPSTPNTNVLPSTHTNVSINS